MSKVQRSIDNKWLCELLDLVAKALTSGEDEPMDAAAAFLRDAEKASMASESIILHARRVFARMESESRYT